MNWKPIEQLTKEWYDLKVGKISGTRFGQVISGRKNALIYELLNEKLDGFIMPDDYTSNDMQFGIDNEPIALSKYSAKSGIAFVQGGVILSDHSNIHMASPDGVSVSMDIVAEIKCTRLGAKHIQRFIEGPESGYIPQVINYFAQSKSVKQVHWISYCPYRPERELVAWVYERTTELEPATAKKPAYTHYAAYPARPQNAKNALTSKHGARDCNGVGSKINR